MADTTTTVPGIRLNNGVTIPQFGFGVFQIPEGETATAVRAALDAGYRHIDTAQLYRNEEAVGEAIRALPRDEVFVTTKLANDAHGHDNAINALEGSLRRLGTDYVDLYLIHWPLPARGRYVETWGAFEEILEAGKARAIGVSNFQPAHLDALRDAGLPTPAVNQIELHPYLQQPELRAYHRKHGIATEAWSPIAQGEVLGDPVLTDLAAAHDKTPAQIVLRWHIQLGNIVFPKSVNPRRIRENIDIFDFELTDDQLTSLAKLDRGHRTGFDPDTFEG
ncbi:aldo/keto reductase [Amycolatopsis acidicola]|uniref:Aldo/keto reductase n=1 Tax=Amycolatopsis acidicola TaxID=2596893 RepID=A0A5N0UK39_9PSEU|nr:aldo/keto reductase [Amycolatopsis acidicola]KAA9149722.1 aldo/keto reductase [Amycolatopsis acidicola]